MGMVIPTSPMAVRRVRSLAPPVRRRPARAVSHSAGPQRLLDNLVAAFSPEPSDLTIYVVDVTAGEKILRNGGPGVTKSDLFAINKIDLAPHVGTNLDTMASDTRRMRTNAQGLKPFVMTHLKTLTRLAEVVAFIETKGMLAQ